MRIIFVRVTVTLMTLLLSLSIAPSAQAHLMVAQHGTLNVVDDGVFMVLSLPISAFEGLDDDKDGRVSMMEFNHHRAAIVESVDRNISLSDAQGKLALQGVMLSPVMPHTTTDQSAEITLAQLIVLGRFSLAGATGLLRFQTGLFGKRADEQTIRITVSRQSDDKEQLLELTPVRPAGAWFF